MADIHVVADDPFAAFVRYPGRYGDPGHLPLPNMEPADPQKFLADIASRGHMMVPRWGYSRKEGDNGHPEWTQFFLLDERFGKHYAVRYEGGKGNVYRWIVCEHEKVEGAGANHSRGWHPGKCRKCGMDMTIDSGD